MKGTSERHYSYTVYADPETARTFDDRRFGGPIGRMVADAQASVLKGFAGDVRGRSVLDVGTGTGRAAFVLAAQGASLTGVDASVEMLAIARQRATELGVEAAFVPGDAHRLEFPDRRFDVVVCLRVLMHTPRWRVALSESCRVSDRLVILDYPSVWSFAALQSVIRRCLHAVDASTEPYRVFSGREMAHALRGFGFEVRSSHRQFVLPIALHKMIGSPRFTTGVEGLLERLGLTRLLGSPVTLVAERCAAS